MHRYSVCTLKADYQGEIFMFDKKVFGENIRALRIKKGENQEQVAKAIGITKQTISGIETGYRAPSIEVAIALAKYFDSCVEDLIK